MIESFITTPNSSEHGNMYFHHSECSPHGAHFTISTPKCRHGKRLANITYFVASQMGITSTGKLIGPGLVPFEEK